ncbi:MAG TPA: methyl-accepting chemotaxis protein [Thermoclostridium caenicola]|nr:methyl-accepting chemotaxis protein [Thermoclostridium caenicola]
MKIKHRITLISVVLCMVCVLAMWSANRFISGIYLETTLQDKLSAEAKLKAHEINAWIGREKQNLEIIAERVIWAENHEFNTLYKVLEKSAAMNYGNLNYLALEDGTFVDVSGWVPDEGYNPLTREWYVKAAENAGKIYVCDPYVDAMTKNLVLTLSKKITLNDGRSGVLGVDMQILDMNEMINAISQQPSGKANAAGANGADYANEPDDANTSYIFLIDRLGNIINHPNPDFAAQPEKVTHVSEILEGKLAALMESSDLQLSQRFIRDYDGKVRAFFFDVLDEADWHIGIAVDQAVIYAARFRFILITMCLSVVLMGVCIVASLRTAGSIAKPIMATKAIAGSISDLNLNIHIDDKYLKRKDETGEIAKAMKGTTDKLRAFTANLHELSAVNNKVYKTTLEKANTLLGLSEEVSATTEELSAGMEETSATAETIAQSVDELNSAISVFANKTEEGARTANEIAIKAAELDRQIVESQSSTMNILNTAKTEIESAIESAKNVEQVKLLADVILDIAVKTNLLSLNASIEAARAGENGRGFALVADEIRMLSEDSNKSAERIKQFAEDINVSVNKLILAANNVLRFLNENVLSDYRLMLKAVENYKNDGSMLSGVLGELSNTVRELTATINTMASSINDVSATIQQATAAAANIAEQNNEMVSAVQEINQAMQMNKESSDRLADMIAQVKL